MNTPRHGWCLLLRRLGYCRAILQSDGEPSIVALKTATLLATSFVELVLRESPIVEHATSRVAESAMREVKRQTRTLKFAFEAHEGKIVEAHSILKWIPTMAADAISFFSTGKDGLTAFFETIWTRLEEARYKIGRIRLVPPSGSKSSCKWDATKAVCGAVSWTPRANWQHFFSMATDGVVKAAGFRRMNKEN